MESWFKVSADVFNSEKIKILRADTKIGDSLALMWFFLLALARKKNDGGYVYATEGVAYTPKTLAAVGGFKPKIAETALEVFQQYNMIDIEENGYIYIVGWSEYQNAEELSKLKERERCKEAMRAKRQREKQSKTCNNDVTNVDVTECYEDVTCNKSVTSQDVTRNNDVTNVDVTDKNKNKKENKSKSNNNNFSSGCYDKNAAVTCNSYENVTSDNNPVAFWNQNVTPITPYIAERLQAIAKEHGELIAMQAVTITAQQGKKSIAYCEGVARNLASGDNQKPKKPPDDFKPPDDQTDLDKYF
jgi:predicted phage replisome organizer|nr:MAG TPA_asm: replisome organizer [Caudoviricetes sp.]